MAWEQCYGGTGKENKGTKREWSTLAYQLQHAVTVVHVHSIFHRTIDALVTPAWTCSSVVWSPHSPQSRHEVRSGMMESALIPPGAPRRPAAPEETGTADASRSWVVGHVGVHNSLSSCGMNNPEATTTQQKS